MVTVLSALAGAVVAAVLAVGGVAALSPSVDKPVPANEMVKYGDNGHT